MCDNLDVQDDEFAIYDSRQQRMRYLVEFVVDDDEVKNVRVIDPPPSDVTRHKNTSEPSALDIGR